jgi:hypothetical protein
LLATLIAAGLAAEATADIEEVAVSLSAKASTYSPQYRR